KRYIPSSAVTSLLKSATASPSTKISIVNETSSSASALSVSSVSAGSSAGVSATSVSGSSVSSGVSSAWFPQPTSKAPDNENKNNLLNNFLSILRSPFIYFFFY